MKKKMCAGSFCVFLLLSICACVGPERVEEIQSPVTEMVETKNVETEVQSESCEEEMIDLTVMGSDMIYATVYQMMMNPDSYIGKQVKIEGSYYTTWYEPTDKYYHYVIVKDAMACCAQGIEFVLGEGEFAKSAEYPESDEEVVVCGTFATYREEGDENLYCRLENATLVINEGV